ncbi:transmembrane GTPase fzo [Strongylocentrotus purpuratus]|uniref:Dynamin-type G domain-containing protein n=1 Tax=Strongylocentrotus purpuratus TaxID=7668 RepID=A0A7M7HKH6_STRPU|nr:transmembrane GTPase fzo [Strongylocentrotus purpuratus]
MCNANSGRSLDASYLIEIHLSEGDVKEDHLLNYDIQIMDCPGITKCRELGDKVKAFCADSDVHVLIVNPKTVMSPEERDHFVEVGKRLPKPDIIVGFTQWDLSARERRPEEVKARHVDSIFEMLKELDVVNTREEAEERCFFYSGREALDLALGEEGFLVRGWEERFKTFQNFISKIEERATSAGITTKLNLNRDTCQEVLHQCIGSLSALEKRMQNKTSDFKNDIESIRSKLKSYDEKMAEFVKESKDLRTKALVTIDESISRCMAEVSDKMSQTLRINSDNDGFEEDQVHQYAERAILIWYRKILDEFQRATDKVCEDYSFYVRASYEKHMAMFPQDTPRAYLLDNQDEQEQPNSIPGSPIPRAALQRVLSGINVRPVWASFASTRRRLSSVETDAERNALIRGMAAATGVFFMHVRQWIRVSVEQKLERLTTKEKDFLICPPIRVKCREAVEIFCDNADGYYRETCIREVQEVLQTQKAKLEEKHSQMIQLSTDFVNLRAEADQIKCKDNSDDHMTE